MAGTASDKLAYLSATKSAIKSAIEAKGVSIPENTTFREYAEKIADIPEGMQIENVYLTVSKGKSCYAISYNESESCLEVKFLSNSSPVGISSSVVKGTILITSEDLSYPYDGLEYMGSGSGYYKYKILGKCSI